VAGFEPTASSSRTRIEDRRYLCGYLSPQVIPWSALVRRGAIEPFALDHLPDFSQRETELHVPTATTDNDHLRGGTVVTSGISGSVETSWIKGILASACSPLDLQLGLPIPGGDTRRLGGACGR
jgi:hypothetical protein